MTLTLALLLLAQDPEALVRRLGSENARERDEAQSRLIAMGEAAEEALKRAAQNSDPEVVVRARAVLDRIESDRALRQLEARQRPKKLNLVTLDVENVPLHEVLTQLDLTLEGPEALRSRPTTLYVKAVPRARILDELGLVLQEPARAVERAGPATAVFAEGVSASFSLRPWAPKGTRLGTLVATSLTRDFRGRIEWSIAEIAAAAPVAFDT